MTRLGVAAALVDGEIVPGDVEVDGGAVAAVGVAPAGAAGLAAPGFIDVQVNGYAGVDFLATDAAGLLEAGAAMARAGVTAYQPTLISMPEAAYAPALTAVRDARDAQPRGARVLGAHLEGPFLSPKRVGAHNPANVVAPDLALAARLLDLGPITHMTVAVEEPGGEDLVRFLVGRGVVVALGHSDADADAARRGFDLGARAVTHLFNAQRRWESRDPGLPGVALTRDDVFVTLIVDGFHLAPETTQLAWRAAGGRFVLVTDAIEAAGMPDGPYVIGDRQTVLRDGAVRLADGTLAGSALTMDAAVRNLVDLGVPAPDALAAASRVAARLLRREDEFGDLRPGMRADVVVLDDALAVRRTLVGGDEVFAA